MKILKRVRANKQHPVYEVRHLDDGDGVAYNQMITELTTDDLPDDMSLGVKGSLFHFATKSERIQWMFGFQKAWEICSKIG